jgi:DnaJ-class molecular chaperone
MPQVNSSIVGDLYVQVRVVTPTNLSHDEVRLLEQFREFDKKRDLKIEKGFVDRLKDWFR